MGKETPYSDAVTWFENKTMVTIGCGTTCAYLGDERNLREFLIADETAQRLRDAGHVVVSLLINDSLDSLDYRQLRVAASKDEALIEKWVPWCGRPISQIPDPWDCHASYAAHFEDLLLDRLRGLGCYPNLVSTACLYEGGIYAPYVRQVLEHHDEMMEYICRKFAGYQPEKLFWLLCPHCGYMDETQIEKADNTGVTYKCGRCGEHGCVSIDDAKGKLNWKLDCAARWVILNIDAEPFSKAYLEPHAGSFVVAQDISKEFFGGHDVLPLRYGAVQMPKDTSYRLLPTIPGDMLRNMFTEHPTTDLHLTPDYLRVVASRYQVEYGLSYLDWIKQLMPMWLLRPQSLTRRQLYLVAHGINFAREFMELETGLQLPTREHLADIEHGVLESMHGFLSEVLHLREVCGSSWEEFCEPAKQLVQELGDHKHEVSCCLRALLGQKQGPPITRLLFLIPTNYLEALEYILHLRLGYLEQSRPVTLKLVA